MPETNQKPRVLLVDDDQIICSLLMLTLEKNGYEVISVSNGLAAMDEYAQRHFDFIITDMMMPGMEGIELIGAIIDNNPEAKIIAISSDQVAGYTSFLMIAETVGASACLKKPFTAEELLETLKRIEAEDERPKRKIIPYAV